MHTYVHSIYRKWYRLIRYKLSKVMKVICFGCIHVRYFIHIYGRFLSKYLLFHLHSVLYCITKKFIINNLKKNIFITKMHSASICSTYYYTIHSVKYIHIGYLYTPIILYTLLLRPMGNIVAYHSSKPKHKESEMK